MDVLSYVFVIAALLWWKRPAAADSALSENFLGAFRAGLRYTRASKELHRVPLRAAVFFLFASAVWALLPLVARQMLGGSSGFYGVLLGAVGAGRSWARCCCRAWTSWTRTAWCCWRPWPARP